MRVKEILKMKYWDVEGVHIGKPLQDLPITYLLWFVGSHQMRRVRWPKCKEALWEIRERLVNCISRVEDDLLIDLQPKNPVERRAMKNRRAQYRKAKIKKR